jgi:biopolymer transport protein ExbB
MFNDFYIVIQRGGIVLLIIMLFSVAATYLIIRKWLYYNKIQKETKRFTPDLLKMVRTGDMDKAKSLCNESHGIMSRIMSAGLPNLKIGKEDIERYIHEIVLDEMPLLEKSLSTIAVIATMLPMLGLLGTVTGMISTFDVIAMRGTGDPNALAAGISEALITTEAGLITALPILFFHNQLSNRFELIVSEIEKNIMKFLNLVSSDK